MATPAARPLWRRPRKEKLADMEYLMKKTLRAFSSLAFMAALIAAPASADEVKAGDLVITQAWSRATPGGAKIGGGYLTIANMTGIDCGRRSSVSWSTRCMGRAVGC